MASQHAISQRTRDVYADALQLGGPAFTNVANSVRAGFENIWITPGLIALEAALRYVPAEEAEDED